MSFGRVLTAMVTPMLPDRSVDLDGAAHLARHLIETGSDGIVVSGSTGESPTLTFAEKVDLFAAVKQTVGPDVTVIAGTGSNATDESISLTREAEKIGVDGVMLVVPYYNRPTQDGMYEHFRAIAEETALPVMLYNVPGRTSQNLLPKTVAKLADSVPNIVAIKEASGNLEQVSEVRLRTPDDFAVYSGDDALTLPIMAIGGEGVVSVSSHLVADQMQTMMRTFLAGDVVEARRIHHKLLPLFQAMFVTTNPIPVKVAMQMIGIETGPFRLPLTKPSEDEYAAIRQALVNFGLLSQ